VCEYWKSTDTDFSPDGNVSADIRELTNLEAYPVDSHRANLKARIEAVVKAGDKLDSRDPSECMRLGPPTDDRVM